MNIGLTEELIGTNLYTVIFSLRHCIEQKKSLMLETSNMYRSKEVQ